MRGNDLANVLIFEFVIKIGVGREESGDRDVRFLNIDGLAFLWWYGFVDKFYLSPQSAQKIFGGEIKNHLLYFVSKKADDFTAKMEDYKKAAETFKGKVC